MRHFCNIIPARAGSKRIPHKNVVDLAGVPLVQWTIATAIDLGLPTYVSTDDDEVSALAIKLGAIVIVRPDNLCQDTSTDRDVIAHALDIVDAECVVYLRPTTPFRSVERCQAACKAFYGAQGASGLRSIHRAAESFHKGFGLARGNILRPAIHPKRGVDGCNDPDQTYPASYVGNGYIDIITRETIENGGTFGNHCMGFVTPAVIEIDTPEQLDYARYLATFNRRFSYGKTVF